MCFLSPVFFFLSPSAEPLADTVIGIFFLEVCCRCATIYGNLQPWNWLDCVWLCWTRWGSEDCDQPVHVHKRGTPATAWRGSALHAAHNVWRGTELVCALLLSLSVDQRKLNIYGSWRICLFAFPVDMGSATFIWLFFLFLVESYVVVDARCELF